MLASAVNVSRRVTLSQRRDASQCHCVARSVTASQRVTASQCRSVVTRHSDASRHRSIASCAMADLCFMLSSVLVLQDGVITCDPLHFVRYVSFKLSYVTDKSTKFTKHGRIREYDNLRNTISAGA